MAVYWAVDETVRRTVDWATYWSLNVALWRAVEVAVSGAVSGAVLQSLNDFRHPELKDFLREASAGEGVSWKNGP